MEHFLTWVFAPGYHPFRFLLIAVPFYSVVATVICQAGVYFEKFENKERNDKASKVVDAIIEDLTDRRGLRGEWGQIDDDIKAEIRETWIAIVKGEE